MESLILKTDIEIKSSPLKIGYDTPILSLGSCFSDYVATKMGEYKLPVVSNPLGTLFNPMSIADSLELFRDKRYPDLISFNERYFSLSAHTSLDGRSEEEGKQKIEEAVSLGHTALQNSKYIILTFGTAFVFEKDDKVVANCHKLPASLFKRRLLEIEEIVSRYTELIAALGDRTIILTLSPVRHLADGMADNSLSKAILRVAISRLCRLFSGKVLYFPSYEIILDDLRDYRFYSSDLVHPNETAINYVFEQFTKAYMNDDTLKKMAAVEKIVKAAGHRPFSPQSEEYRKFCRANLELISKLPDIDLSKEKLFFLQHTDK